MSIFNASAACSDALEMHLDHPSFSARDVPGTRDWLRDLEAPELKDIKSSPHPISLAHCWHGEARIIS